jgi:hypothetical protein
MWGDGILSPACVQSVTDVRIGLKLIPASSEDQRFQPEVFLAQGSV